MNKKKSIIIILVLIGLACNINANLNTLRENELIYKNGLQFKDNIHPAVGASLSGTNVCHQLLISSTYCSTPYGRYWQEFAQNGATIATMDVTLVRDQGKEEDFKILVSDIIGNPIGVSKSDASGFVTDIFGGLLGET